MAPTLTQPVQRPGLQEALRALVELVETHRVPEAREMVIQLSSQWPDSEAVRHWVAVLEPPRATVLKQPTPLQLAQRRAVRGHLQAHPGCWLAMYGAELVAAGTDIELVRAAARKHPHPEDVQFVSPSASPDRGRPLNERG